MPFDASKLIAGLAEAKRRKMEAALRAVDRFGQVPVLSNAQAMTPVDTGFLVASAVEEPARISGETITKQVGFNAEYAAAVHENLTAQHGQGQAKFLEESMRRAAPEFGPAVAAAVAAVEGSAGGAG